MKFILIPLFVLATAITSHAQTTTEKPKRSVLIHLIHKDSVNLALNENFNRIEDSCATMIRYSRIIPKEHKYIGKFKDISQLDTSLVLTEGEYTSDGLKTGLFTAYHLNGELQSKGVYKNNNYDGHWEVYYDDGKPHLFFDAVNDTIKITDVWDASGKQTVLKGKGTYTVSVKPFTWEGKLNNGRPDGTWHAYKTDDASKNALVDEYFKNGAFDEGKGPTGKYTDASRMVIINAEETFPYTRAEKFLVASVACNMTKRLHYVVAQYPDGRASYTLYLRRAIAMGLVNHRGLLTEEYPLKITGNVSETGILVDMKSEGPFDQGLAQSIMVRLREIMPVLQPASADGVPVKEPFIITVSFKGNFYYTSYRFLPIKRG